MAICLGLKEYITQLGHNPSIAELLAYPTICDYQFYAKLLGFIFIILTITLYEADRNRLPKPDIISALGVSSIAILSLALVGTLIGIIQKLIFIEIMIFSLVFMVIWFFKK